VARANTRTAWQRRGARACVGPLCGLRAEIGVEPLEAGSAKIAYVAISSDIIHNGHVNIIEEAARYGEVLVGLLTDEAVAAYKRLPLLDFDSRKRLLESIRHVGRVVPQEELSYARNLRRYRPDFVVHGDDWRAGLQMAVRKEVVEVLGEYGGRLVEVPYTNGVSGSALEAALRPLVTTVDSRRGRLRRLLRHKPYVRAIEASNGLSGLIVESLQVADEGTGAVREFDAMWVSSLCDSSFKGKPDIELVDLTSRLATINEIMEVTTKPIILDGDTGGRIEHFAYTVRTLERLGVSAVIIEDKTGLKQNSLFGTDALQVLEDPDEFARKVNAGKQHQVTTDFMVVARVESLIAGAGMDDALGRARTYVEAGADGIMIHSREKDGREIAEFLSLFKAAYPDIPVVLVPTSYNHITEDELCRMGASVVIHANHLLRSAYPAMLGTARTILESGRSREADDRLMPISEVLSLIPGEA